MTACLLMLSSFAGGVKFVEHDGGEVDIDALNGRHHFSGIREKNERTSFSTIGEARNGLGGKRSLVFLRVLFIEFPFPDAWISKA